MTNVSGTTITLSQALTSTISGAALVFSSVTTTQTRTFAYDSAGRLTSATNPENGTVTYTYNTTNTLATKTDAKGQQTAYTYDSKNRVTEVQRFVPQYGYQVEDVCQRVTYTYDTNPVNVNFSQYSTGRLTTVTYYGQNASGGSGCGLNPQIYAYDTYTEMYSYLAAGAVTAKNVSLARALGGAYNPDPPISLEVDYTYDSAGRTLTSTYPMGFQPSGYPQPVLTTGYDAMGRPSSLTDSYSDDWVSGVRRDYAGRLTNMSWLYEPSPYYTSQESRTYNGNGQLASINWPSMGIQYNYSATQNNGQITQEVDNGTAITYQYDPLKRLTSASGGATQTFQYDGFGNLTQKVLNGTSTPIPVNPATNQLTNAYYDANGNMTSGAGATFTYDEANRVTTVTETSGGETFYGYDASNKRIYERDPRLGEVFIFFGAKGEKLGRYGIASGCYPSGAPLCFQAQVTNVWFAGRLVATTNAGGGGAPVYQDRLGTNRATGGYYQTYYPYGDGAAGTDSVQFATYTRDSYTGLDYADQRFYASTYGRFLTADRKRGKRKNPGSLNRYAYALGDPVNHNDPRGLSCVEVDGVWQDDGDGYGCPDAGQSVDDDPGQYYYSFDIEAYYDSGDYDEQDVESAMACITDPACMQTISQIQVYGPPGCLPGTTPGPDGSCLTPQQLQQYQVAQCMSSFNSSPVGSMVNFLSAINLVTDFGNSYLDWTLLPAAKGVALELLKTVSSDFGSTEFLSVTGASAGTVVSGEGAVLVGAAELVAAPLGLGAMSAATAIDAGVRQMCTAVPGITF